MVVDQVRRAGDEQGEGQAEPGHQHAADDSAERDAGPAQ